jgi:hypothetical protein
MYHKEFEIEARKCIEIQSHLSTCLYDWAVAHTLYEKKILCWSPTVAYYAMMQSARTLFSLIWFDPSLEEPFKAGQTKRERLRKIMTQHKALCNFLEKKELSNDDGKLHDLCIERFEECFPSLDWSSFLSKAGNILALHKEAREAENYEHFVVAHHGREYHFESPFIEILFQKSEDNANKYLTEALSYVVKFYQRKIPMCEYHLWHLKDELWWLERTLTKEDLQTSNAMKAFLIALRKLVEDVKQPQDYLDFEREMDMNYYTEKNRVYSNLKDLAARLKRY